MFVITNSEHEVNGSSASNQTISDDVLSLWDQKFKSRLGRRSNYNRVIKKIDSEH